MDESNTPRINEYIESAFLRQDRTAALAALYAAITVQSGLIFRELRRVRSEPDASDSTREKQFLGMLTNLMSATSPEILVAKDGASPFDTALSFLHSDIRDHLAAQNKKE